MNRISRCAALVGTVLSLSSFAQECQEISLYKDGSEIGKMVEDSRTFPESPEWSANWGHLDGMIPPYIRLSGQKDKKSDWSGEFSFGKMPVKIKGGFLKLKLRATQKVRAGLWLAGDFGKSLTHTVDVEANKTYSLEIPVKNLAGDGVVNVSRVGVGLVGIPAYQYTTLFIDDVMLTCGVSNSTGENAAGSSGTSLDEAGGYVYSDIDAMSPIREGKFIESGIREVSAAYAEEKRLELSSLTHRDFVVSASEQRQLENFVNETNLSPKKSRDGWYSSLYFVERNRLRDNVIANPKALFYEAETFAAGTENRQLPLLIGNVDYGYEKCADTSCAANKIVDAQLLVAGLPVSTVKGSVIQLHYDPYFVTTNRKSLPIVEVFNGKTWTQLSPKSNLEIRFESAGIQKIRVRLSEGGKTVVQNLFVEVK